MGAWGGEAANRDHLQRQRCGTCRFSFWHCLWRTCWYTNTSHPEDMTCSQRPTPACVLYNTLKFRLVHKMQVLAASSLCELQFAQPLQANCTLAWHFSPKKALRTCVFLESKRNIRRNFPPRNAELANGRLALLSAQQRATRVKARAAKTEEEELFVCGGWLFFSQRRRLLQHMMEGLRNRLCSFWRQVILQYI